MPARTLYRPAVITGLLLLLFGFFAGAVSATTCPALCSQPLGPASQSQKTVVQFIEGTFYKWQEFTRPDGPVAVYLLEPEERLLTEDEAAALFRASRQWQVRFDSTALSSGRSDSSITHYRPAENIIDHPGAAGVDFPLFTAMVDDRTALNGNQATVYPYFNSGFLTIDFNLDFMRGSAFLISPHVALTNAHNLYSASLGGWYTRAVFSPGQYETRYPNTVQPFGSLSPVDAEINDNYIYHDSLGERTEAIKYDYGALFFNETFSGINTFVPLEFGTVPTAVMVTGYPGIVKSASSLGMWKAEGSLLDYDSHCLYYTAFTSGGSSGSPVLAYNAQSGTYRVVAVHSFASFGNFSGGPHFNDLNRAIIETWMRWTPGGTSDAVTALTLDKLNMTLDRGAIEALVATVQPAGLDGVELIWSSSNSAVASVNADGMVSALAPGQAVITVRTSDGTLSASSSVTVVSAAGEIGVPGIFPTGDVNGDGAINVRDVTLVMQHILILNTLEGGALIAADVNGDGDVNVLDVTLLMQFSLGLIPAF